MGRALERARRQLADSIVVQQQRAQSVVPVKRPLVHVRDVVKSEIPGEKKNQDLSTRLEGCCNNKCYSLSGCVRPIIKR